MNRRAKARLARSGSLTMMPGQILEALERRELLTGYNYYAALHAPYPSLQLQAQSVPTPTVAHPIGLGAATLATLDNEGRFLSGKDRQGDEWSLTIHGPGKLIVTDTTPNDGALDDDIQTIQIVGSSPTSTYVTGNVSATARNIVDANTGTVFFHQLIAQKGVRSIILNGFSLTNGPATISGQPANTGPAIYLPGGVQTLSFNDIVNLTDLAGNGSGADQPLEIQIGDPNTPLKYSPTITLHHIFNTVIDSTSTSQAGLGPQTNPSVNILVNGNLHALNIDSATGQTFNGGYEFNYPRVDVTGRTAVRAVSADKLVVQGSARNFTLSRAGVPFQPQNGQGSTPTATTATTLPFQDGFSGLKRLRSATFGGTADAVGLDVSGGTIGKVKFLKGLGDPSGTTLNATQYGGNAAQAGYASRGLLGGLVVAKRIGSVTAGAANLTLQTGQNPDFQQIYRTRSQVYYPRAGRALTNAAIVSSKSIHKVNIVGDAQNSEVAAGNDYPSFNAGLQPVRSASKINKFRQRGDLIDSVISASYSANDSVYGNGNDTAGPGTIVGKHIGKTYVTGNQTALSNFGSGIYARRKVGKLS